MMTERKTYDKHGSGLLWRTFPSPEEFAEAAHKIGISIARTLDLMSQRTGMDRFTWDDQEVVIWELIKLQDHAAARASFNAAKEGVADGTKVCLCCDDQSCTVCAPCMGLDAYFCKACDENDGICICP